MMAARLAEKDPESTVALVEAGGEQRRRKEQCLGRAEDAAAVHAWPIDSRTGLNMQFVASNRLSRAIQTH